MSDVAKYRGSVTDAQLDYLIRLRVPFEFPLSRSTASWLISSAARARRRGPATPRQEEFLKRRGLGRDGLTLSEASDLIGQIIEEENSRL